MTNIAASIAFGVIFKVKLINIQNAIAEYQSENNRSQKLKIGNVEYVLDAYNANPSSMKVALEAFSKRSGKKAVILGHMAELGTYESSEHKALVDLVLDHDFDACYWVGKPYELLVDTNYFKSVKELNEFLRNNPVETDQILIKGSRSATLEKVLDIL